MGPTRTITSKLKPNNQVKAIDMNTEEFQEGIDVLPVKAKATKEDVEVEISYMLNEAKKEAEMILTQAKLEAESIKKDAYTEGEKQGHHEGLMTANKELDQKKEELDKQADIQKKQYHDMVKELEPTMVRIMTKLIEKITGIIVEDKEEVILHLIKKAFESMGKAEEYIVRVSSEDFEYVSSKKDYLRAAINNESSLTIREDSSLKKNQCTIEDDFKLIDSSLDVQLKNLITDLRLLL